VLSIFDTNSATKNIPLYHPIQSKANTNQAVLMLHVITLHFDWVTECSVISQRDNFYFDFPIMNLVYADKGK